MSEIGVHHGFILLGMAAAFCTLTMSIAVEMKIYLQQDYCNVRLASFWAKVAWVCFFIMVACGVAGVIALFWGFFNEIS
jgi:hypothetical protein